MLVTFKLIDVEKPGAINPLYVDSIMPREGGCDVTMASGNVFEVRDTVEAVSERLNTAERETQRQRRGE